MAGRVVVSRRLALRAAAGTVRPMTLAGDLELAGLDELLQRRVVDRLGRDLSRPPGPEMEGLAAGQRNAQGPLGLVGDGLHRRLLLRTVGKLTLTGGPSKPEVWIHLPACVRTG